MKSIGFKLWLGMMGLIAFMLLLLWLFQIVFLENFYTNMRVAEVRNTAQSLLSLFENNYSDFEKKMDQFSYNNNISVELWDSKNTMIFISSEAGANAQMPMGRNNAKLNAQEQVLSGKEVSISLTHPRFGNKFMLIGLPLKLANGNSYGLILNMPLAPVTDTVSILKKQLIIITFILFAVAMVLSYIISSSFTHPILRITQVAANIATGDFSTKVEIKSKDEIGKLGQTINMMSEELSKIDALRKDLISNVSHELRTPLSIIRGYAETIRDVTGDNPQKRVNHLSIIIEESERLGTIVDDILNLSQLQSGNIHLDINTFRIDDTLSAVIKRYEVLSASTGVLIKLEDVPQLSVQGDVKRIEQVLFNLINNAFNHTPTGGSIYLRTSIIDDFLRVEVADTGSGISKEDITHIWDRYYKSYNDHSKRNVGTGLGLSIVKSILDSHDVQYGVESKKDLGTSFWFYLKKL